MSDDSKEGRCHEISIDLCNDCFMIQYFGNIVPLPKLACAQIARIEIHSLKTMTLTDEQFLTGVKEGKPDIIAGELRIPQHGKVPAMILVHGSAGIMDNVDSWSKELNKIGIATFVLDGFAGRGIVDVVTDQEQLGTLTMINDAYRVLELLAKHPRIDPSRIGIMGFSRGGQVALYASLKRFKRMHAPSDVEFAAYLGFYPLCFITFIDDGEVSDKPIRLFHGLADDYVPISPCQEYVKRLQKAGKDVQLIEYPDAYHNFDLAVIRAPMRLPGAQTARNCRMEENPVGRIVTSQTEPCVERGATIAYNAQAHSESLKAVKEFLTMTFTKAQTVQSMVSTPSAQTAEKGVKKTITLPNGEVIWDLNGEWNALGENYGPWSQFGTTRNIIKITQTGSSLVGIRMEGNPWMPPGSEAIRGELDKSGFKKIQIISAMGPLDSKGQISEDGNKMIIDDGEKCRVTYTRK